MTELVDVLLPVEGHNLNSVACLPDQFLLKVGPLQVGGDLVHPLFGGDWRKLLK